MESLQRFKIKLLATRHGHPEKALKLILISGTPTSDHSASISTTARLTQEVLVAAGLKSAVIATEDSLPAATLYQFLDEAVKEENSYAIITAPLASLTDQTFYALTPFVAAITHTDGSATLADGAEKPDFSPLFANHPENIVLNHDDPAYDQLSIHRGSISTLAYGASSGSDVRIESSNLYKKGTEAIISHGPKNFTVASFLTGESAISTMATVAAIASALHITPTAIIDGLANYTPEATT